MSATIKQVYDANPSTTVLDTDLVYLGKSPYGSANSSAVLGANLFAAGAGLTKTGNSLAITNTAVSAGTFGSASQAITLTVNARGQLTAISGSSISINSGNITDFITTAGSVADGRIANAIATSVLQQYNANLQGLSGLLSTGRGQLFENGLNTFITNTTTFTTSLSFSIASYTPGGGGGARVVNWGETICLNGSGNKTITLDPTGDVADQKIFYFLPTNVSGGTGTVTFTTSGGTATGIIGQTVYDSPDFSSPALPNDYLITCKFDFTTNCYIVWQTINFSRLMLRTNNLNDIVSQPAARSNLGLGTIAIQNSSAVSITGGTITGTNLNTLAGRTSFNLTGTTLTLDATYANTTVRTTNTGANTTITVPLNSTSAIPAGTQIELLNLSGAANNRLLTVSFTGGITLVSSSIPVLGHGGYCILEKVDSADTWNVIVCYEQWTSSGNRWTGPWAATQFAEYVITRNNNCVNFDFLSAQVGTTSSTANTVSNTVAIPARLCPTNNVLGMMQVQSNATQVFGRTLIQPSGILIIGSSAIGAAFSATGSALIFRSGAGMKWLI
jgi:hypothetical protein